MSADERLNALRQAMRARAPVFPRVLARVFTPDGVVIFLGESLNMLAMMPFEDYAKLRREVRP